VSIPERRLGVSRDSVSDSPFEVSRSPWSLSLIVRPQRSGVLVTVLGVDKRAEYSELFRREYPGLIGELTLILGDRGLAEDVAGDAFVDLWRKWHRVSEFDRPGAWVRLVALRKASRARWRRDRRSVLEHESSRHELVSSVSETDVDLLRALDELSPSQRTAVVMHYLGGWPTKDIAEVLGCSEVTVRSHLTRGRQRLAVLLGDDTDVEVNDVGQL
jgi:RNA polymerase sigma-70 factor, ECF subfamily